MATTKVTSGLVNITSGSGVQKGNGSGGLTAATAGTDYAKPDTASTWSVTQKGTRTTDNDGSFDLSVTNLWKCTPTGAVTLTFTNNTDGIEGNIIFINGSNYAVTMHANTKSTSGLATTLSATGTYVIHFSTDGTNAYVSSAGAMA